MQQRPRNPYSSAEIDRASHERENEERMIELASSGAAIVSNPYEGIERWFEPGRDLVVVH